MDLVLAVSWEPAFCEGHASKRECRAQTGASYEASNLALHGLWPEGVEYCGVDGRTIATDRDGDWRALPPVEIGDALGNRLAEVMPGTKSALERHEWLRHGTCFGTGQRPYFARAVALMDALNASPVRDLFAANVGRTISLVQIRGAFDRAFGKGSGSRVTVDCAEDGRRRLIAELQISLRQNDPADDLPAMLRAATPASGGCPSGIVDPVGLQ
jgi:ribonuclease T2